MFLGSCKVSSMEWTLKQEIFHMIAFRNVDKENMFFANSVEIDI